MNKKKWLLLLVLIGFSSIAQANLTLTAPPRENAKDALRYYGPIAEALGKYLGEPVSYHHPKNWIEYAREMRAGKYDVVFDGPQFASWRMVHVDHQPIVSLDGKLQFVVVALQDRKDIKKMKDVLGKKLCGLASPNLGTLAAFNLFDNPIIQPTVTNVKGGMKAVVKNFMEGKCDAAIIRADLINRMPEEKKNKIKVLAKSRVMPNQSITASKRIDVAKRKKMQEFFLSPDGAKAADLLLDRFSKKKKYFVSPDEKDFSGLNELLEGVVFGW